MEWSFAGIATFIALFLTLSLIGFSIGLTTLSPLAENPFRNIGTNVTIWTIISLIISFAGGGFVSGLVANKAGFLHGFMTWAIGVILIASLVTTTVTSVLSTTGNVISSVGSSIGNVGTSALNNSEDNLNKMMDSLSNQIINVDTDKLQKEINNVLEDTDVKELQPEYLNKQLQESKEDIKKSFKSILLNPESYQDELNDLLSKLETRSTNITSSIDKDTIANAVSKNTELTKEEADIAVDNIYNEYQEASIKASEMIELAKKEVNSLSENVDEFTEDVKLEADHVTDTGAKSSMYLFLGLIIALFITSFSGVKGANFIK